MDQSKLLELQLQMRQNNTELQSFLTGLDSWTSDIKEKDEELLAAKSTGETPKLPPVRNSLTKKKKKKREKPKSKDVDGGKKRISGFDFRAWDKYDVDKAVEEVDKEEKSSSEYETDEEWEMERRVQQANVFKDQGNIAFKEQRYDEAIEFYTQGMDCDPTNAILPANRAMALLKQEKFGAAEVDCTTSLALNPTYVKAYSRRGTARAGLGRLEDARLDFEMVLSIEPNNKFALTEKRKLEEKLKPADEVEINEESGIVRAIYKPPEKRSKKPLRRIQIEELGADDGKSIREAIAKTEASQGDAKRRVTEQDGKMFEQFVSADKSDTKGPIQEINSSETEPEHRLDGQTTDTTSTENITPSVVEEHKTLSLPSEVSGSDKSQGSVSKAMPRKQVTMETSPSGSPRVPDVPNSSFQFQADWKILKNHPDKFYQYFKKIEPSQYVKLFGQALDADILSAILLILRDFYLPAKVDVYPVVKNLADVKRFSMTVMFMSAKDKKVLHAVFAEMKSSGLHNSEDIERLSKKYEL